VTLMVGHDSNIASLLTALDFKPYQLTSQNERTPIGGMIQFQRWLDKKNKRELVKVEYVYQSTDQLRNAEPLSLENPPKRVTLQMAGCETDANGFCSWDDFTAVLNKALQGTAMQVAEPAPAVADAKQDDAAAAEKAQADKATAEKAAADRAAAEKAAADKAAADKAAKEKAAADKAAADKAAKEKAAADKAAADKAAKEKVAADQAAAEKAAKEKAAADKAAQEKAAADKATEQNTAQPERAENEKSAQAQPAVG